MKLSDQVCNPELSKRLHELGVAIEAFAYYLYQEGEREPFLYCKQEEGYAEFDCWIGRRKVKAKYNAYTTGELGLMLQREDPVRGLYPLLLYRISPKGWFIELWIGGEVKQKIYDDSEADSRAKALICCIENGLVDIGDINNDMEISRLQFQKNLKKDINNG